MCGIVGIAGNLNLKDCKAFKDMLLFDTVRGVDSTGILSVPLKIKGNYKTPIIEKEVGLPDALWENDKTKIFNWQGQIKTVPRLLLGHNRAATVGRITSDNAHPFRFKDLYGVHNGTLRNYADLENYVEHPIDSMCLLDTIQVKGIGHAWSNFIGAAAVVWWDDFNDTINFARNKERPLYISYNEEEDVILWASESWMVEVAAMRNGIKLKKNKEGSKDIFLIDTDKHYSYEITNLGYKSGEVVNLKPKEIKPHVFTNNNSVGFRYMGTSSRIKNFLNHIGWTKNMTRCGKETRGLRIEIRNYLEESGKFIARFVNETDTYKGVIHIYPNNKEQVLQIQKALESGNNQFKTISRMHCLDKGSWIMWGISSQGLRPCAINKKVETENKVETKEVDEDICRFRSFGGKMVSESRWKELLSSGPGSNCSCAWCSQTLDPKDHREIVFLSKEDALCPECSTEPNVIGNLAHIYPNIQFSYVN